MDLTPIESKGRLRKVVSLGMDKDTDVDEDHKSWKKFPLRLTLRGEKSEYVVCAPDKESQRTWADAFKPIFHGKVQYCAGPAASSRPRSVSGTSTVPLICIIHKSELAFFELCHSAKQQRFENERMSSQFSTFAEAEYAAGLNSVGHSLCVLFILFCLRSRYCDSARRRDCYGSPVL